MIRTWASSLSGIYAPGQQSKAGHKVLDMVQEGVYIIYGEHVGFAVSETRGETFIERLSDRADRVLDIRLASVHINCSRILSRF